jgi:hypothetical protein
MRFVDKFAHIKLMGNSQRKSKDSAVIMLGEEHVVALTGLTFPLITIISYNHFYVPTYAHKFMCI